MVRGSIDLLLLSLLSQRDLYGYEISKVIKRLSEDKYEMSEGTLYPALKRLEKKEWITSYWSENETGRRKYYKMTELGNKELEKKKSSWTFIQHLVKKSSEEMI